MSVAFYTVKSVYKHNYDSLHILLSVTHLWICGMYVTMHVCSKLLHAFPLLADLKTRTAACGGQSLKNVYIKKFCEQKLCIKVAQINKK